MNDRKPISMKSLQSTISTKSREYKIFEEEERMKTLPKSIYEKACNISAKILPLDPDKKSKDKIQEALDFAHISTTPTGVNSLPIVFLLFSLITVMILTMPTFLGLPGLSISYAVVSLLVIVAFTYYLSTYPSRLKSRYEISVGSEMVLLILYMSMYMRNTPNLENSVLFASENLSGPLAFELRKLMWDLEIGRYKTIYEALTDYTSKWKKNKEFVQAIEIITTSLSQVGPRRIESLDEAVNLVLQGSRETARHFNQDLKMPVMIVHALGIILPVMGLVLFPIISVFLGIESTVLFVVYDILLPLILFFVITNILETRPSTFSKVDVSENPDMPPEGKFFYGKTALPAWPIGVLITIIISGLGFILLAQECPGNQCFQSVLPPLLIIGGFAFGAAVYMLLLSKQRIVVRDATREIETQFAEALFQLGNEVSTGTPIELSLENSMKRINNSKVKDLFTMAVNNMKRLGLTFSEAFFDKNYGAIRYYSSRLIKSIIKTIVESSKKGVTTAAIAMLSISKYMKGLHDTQEDVKESLNDTVSSLKFQIYFLSPMISGVVVTMANIMINILQQLGQKTSSINSSNSVPLLSQFAEIHITPFEFIFVVGVYLVETSLILSMFINGIESSEDSIGRQQITGNSLIIGYVVFAIFLSVTMVIFAPLIQLG